MVEAGRLLPTPQEVGIALDGRVEIRVDPGSAPQGVGEVLRAAAVDSAYRRYRGRLVIEDVDRPVTVSALALIFDSDDTAMRTFSGVAQAAHLRTQLGEANVAVETVTTPQGLVSYWGFLGAGSIIMVITLDTLDPKEISIADLRALLLACAQRIDAQQGAGNGDQTR